MRQELKNEEIELLRALAREIRNGETFQPVFGNDYVVRINIQQPTADKLVRILEKVAY